MNHNRMTFYRLLRWCALASLFGCGFGFAEVLAAPQTKTWTDTPDWSAHTKQQNVTWTDVPGQIQLIKNPPKVAQTPFIYIPNSGSNTVTQLDTKTGKLNWTFDLNVIRQKSNPSRTTVDANGHVWLGLRGGNEVVWISMLGKLKKVVKVGNVPRAITVDLDGNVWAGAWKDNTVTKINGKTGEVMLTVRGVPCPYGAVTDINNNIWVVNNCKWNNSNTITKLKSDGSILGRFPAPGAYGIATDANGQIWSANWVGSCLLRIANNGSSLGCIPLKARPRGVAVDANGHVWVPCSHIGKTVTKLVVRLSPTGQTVGRYTDVGRHSIGVAVDADGFVWIISYGDNRAVKINAKTGVTVGKYPTGGSGPYTYSDMTGFAFQSLSKSAQGFWRASHNSKCVSKWKKISWKGGNPPGTSTSVRVRTAPTQSALAQAQWSAPVANGSTPKAAENPWIEVEVSFRTFDAKVTPFVTELSLVSEPAGTEVCNGIDDDCDGRVDNIPGTDKPITRPCSTPCGKGTAPCIAGDWSICSAPYPSPEVCNGQDDDCDGKVDSGATCLGSAVCHSGACARKCLSECPNGQLCKQVGNQKLCIGKQSCKEIGDKCKAQNKVCRNGVCLDPCAGINCPKDYVCSNGKCQKTDCYSASGRCSAGQVCRGGKCVTNPCSNVTCPDGQFCKNGNCEKTCAGVSCPAGQYCRAGRCIGNTCAAVKCQSGQVCSNGQCLKDPCGGVSCRSGQICSQGQCVDNPCSVTRCPVGQVCRLPSGDCFGPNQDPNNNKTSPADEFAQPEGPTTPGFGEDGGSVVGPTTGDKDIQNNANSSNPGGRRGGGACLCATSPGALGATSWGLIGLVFLILIGLRRRH